MTESRLDKLKQKIKDNPIKAGAGAGTALGAGAGLLKGKKSPKGFMDQISNKYKLDQVAKNYKIPGGEEIKNKALRNATMGGIAGGSAGGLLGKGYKEKTSSEESRFDRIKQKIKDNPIKAGVGAGTALGAGAGYIHGKRDHIGRRPFDEHNPLKTLKRFGLDKNLSDEVKQYIDSNAYIKDKAIKRVKNAPKNEAIKGALAGAFSGGMIGRDIKKKREKTSAEEEYMEGLEKVAFIAGISMDAVNEIVKQASSTAPELEGVMAENRESVENEELSELSQVIENLTPEEAKKILEEVRG